MSAKTNNRVVAGCIMGILLVFVQIPIWYYLIFRVLEAVHADTVMWVLFWIYVPVGIACQLAAKAIELTKEG